MKTLLEQILNPSSFKHLTKEEASVLLGLGYNAYAWENLLALKTVTREDLQKRLDVATQLAKLDQELCDRIKAKHPKVKKDDIIETKDYGRLMICKVFEWGVEAFSPTYGKLKLDWNKLSSLLEQK